MNTFPLRPLAGAMVLALLAGPAVAAITAFPASLTFNQAVGATASPQQLTITNGSGAPVNYIGFGMSPSGYFTLNTAGTTCFSGAVPDGGTCTMSVRPLAQSVPGSQLVGFSMTTSQFGSLQVANANLVLLVSGAAPPPGGGTLASVAPRQIALSGGGRTSALLNYAFTGGPATPVDAFVCTQLLAPVISGVSATNPCVPGTQSHSLALETSGFSSQSLAGGTQGRAVETVAFPEAFARLSSALAQQTGSASLYFVRQFSSGGYAVVQLQNIGGSLAAPLTLTDVRMGFRIGGGRQPTASLAPGERAPRVSAEIQYTGSGTLRGRWEVVEPGVPVPEATDLVPEASLTRAERAAQRRFRLIERFEYALGPIGRFELPGPDPARLPTRLHGGYLLLLRIEAVPAGRFGGTAGEDGAAAFSMPVLAYQVGTGIDASTALASRFIDLVEPPTMLRTGNAPAIAWRPLREAHSWRVELADERGVIVGAKFLRAEQTTYQLGGALARQVRGKAARWRVQAFDASRKPVGRSDWRPLAS